MKRLDLVAFTSKMAGKTPHWMSTEARILNFIEQVKTSDKSQKRLNAIALHFQAYMPGWDGSAFINDALNLS